MFIFSIFSLKYYGANILILKILQKCHLKKISVQKWLEKFQRIKNQDLSATALFRHTVKPVKTEPDLGPDFVFRNRQVFSLYR